MRCGKSYGVAVTCGNFKSMNVILEAVTSYYSLTRYGVCYALCKFVVLA